MKTILLVDDDQQLRAMFGVALRKNGYHVLEADSGVAGLEMARRHLPDLILSDIQNDPELRLGQVVLMTGRPDLVTPRKAWRKVLMGPPTEITHPAESRSRDKLRPFGGEIRFISSPI